MTDYDDYSDYDQRGGDFYRDTGDYDPRDDGYDRRDDGYDRRDDGYDRRDDGYDRRYSDELKGSRGSYEKRGSVQSRERFSDEGERYGEYTERDRESLLGEVEVVEEVAPWEVEPKKFDGQTEYVLLLVKPEAAKHEHVITRKVCEEGFLVLQRRKVVLSEEQASELYGEHYGDPGFPRMAVHLSSGPVVALCLTREMAVCRMKQLLGPADVKEARRLFPSSLRAKYGNPRDNLLNALDSSQTSDRAEFEIHFFFPEMTLRPLWSGQRPALFLQEFVLPTLLEGLVEIARVKPVDPVLHLGHWLLLNNPNKPSTNETIALIPT